MSCWKHLHVYKPYLPPETHLAAGQWVEEHVKMTTLRMFRVGTRMSSVLRTEWKHSVSLQIFIKNRTSKWRRLLRNVNKFTFFFDKFRSDNIHLEKSIVAKGCKFSLYAFWLICVSNHTRVPSIFQFGSDQRKIQHQSTVCGGNVKCDFMN
jgi:hypothetical protein